MKMNIKQLPILLMTIGVLTSCGNKKTEETKPQEAVAVEQVATAKATTIQMTKADFLAKVANYESSPEEWKYLGDKPALIDFYADWCGPCKAIAPFLEELAGEYGNDIYIYKVNVDNEQELAALFGIRSIPALLYIPMEGKPQMTQGAGSKDDLKKSIEELLLKKS